MIDRLTENRGLDSFDIRYVALILAILAIGVLWTIAMIRKTKRRTGDKHA